SLLGAELELESHHDNPLLDTLAGNVVFVNETLGRLRHLARGASTQAHPAMAPKSMARAARLPKTWRAFLSMTRIPFMGGEGEWAQRAHEKWKPLPEHTTIAGAIRTPSR